MSAWTDHVAKWRDCQLCPLAQQRTNIVLARGQIPCDVLFIGEAPGGSEDALGQPFKGPAGQLLDRDEESNPGIVQRGLPCHLEWSEVKRRNVWVMDVRLAFCNLVCCYPREAKSRGENEPEHEEIMACRPRLIEFIEIVKPRLVVRVGRLAWDYAEQDAYGRINGAAVEDIIHPAAILRREMPMAQKHYAASKCAVQLRSAWRGVVKSNNSGG